MKKENITAYLMALAMMLMIMILAFDWLVLLIPVIIIQVIIGLRERSQHSALVSGIIFSLVECGVVAVIWGIGQLIRLI